MAKRRLSKEDMKGDEFLSTMDKVTAFFRKYGKDVAIIGGFVFGIALSFYLFYLSYSLHKSRAGDRLYRAVETLQKNEQKALTELKDISDNYFLKDTSRTALIYRANKALEKGNRKKAVKLLSGAAEGGVGTTAGNLAGFKLAKIYEDRGEHKKAEKNLRKIIDNPAKGIPRDYMMLNLARILKVGGKSSEAKSILEKLLEEFPETNYRKQAEKLKESLSQTSPSGSSKKEKAGKKLLNFE